MNIINAKTVREIIRINEMKEKPFLKKWRFKLLDFKKMLKTVNAKTGKRVELSNNVKAI